MQVDELSNIKINFSPESLTILNLSVAFIMFGVALGIQPKDFFRLQSKTKAVFTGVSAQFILLPLLTFLLILLAKPLPGIAAGMVLVAACPGGNVSNFFSSIAGGNLALSVSLTAFASVAAVFLTPINFKFWLSLLQIGSSELSAFTIEFWQIFKTVLLILALPLFLGILFAKQFPKLTFYIQKPVKNVSFLILIGFILVAFAKNFDFFIQYFEYIVYIVFIHNGLAFLSAYFYSKALKNGEKENISISIETGIQNSGLALVIIFNFFDGNGGMSIVAAWWGIWHIISGSILAWFFSKRSKRKQWVQ